MFLAFVNYTHQQFIKQSLMLDKAVYGYFILYFVIKFYFTYILNHFIIFIDCYKTSCFSQRLTVVLSCLGAANDFADISQKYVYTNQMV